MRGVVWVLCGMLAGPAAAAELRVQVSGIRSAEGQIGCALFAEARGFPGEGATVRRVVPADPKGVECRFEGLAPGSYAVAVLHDLNGNGRNDTNFLGLPTEDWGVSNNVRPTLRAPRFDEAAVEVKDGPAVVIGVTVGR